MNTGPEVISQTSALPALSDISTHGGFCFLRDTRDKEDGTWMVQSVVVGAKDGSHFLALMLVWTIQAKKSVSHKN